MKTWIQNEVRRTTLLEALGLSVGHNDPLTDRLLEGSSHGYRAPDTTRSLHPFQLGSYKFGFKQARETSLFVPLSVQRKACKDVIPFYHGPEALGFRLVCSVFSSEFRALRSGSRA